MKIIWTFTLMMIPGVASFSVMGYSGGGVTITCRYDKGYTENAKYFCKKKIGWCSDLIKTDNKDKLFNSGRFSLYDDTSSAVLKVTIRDLSEEDSGMYYCAVDKLAIDLYTAVDAKVITEETSTPSSSTSSSVEYLAIAFPVSGSSLTVSVSVVLLLTITGLVLLTVIL